MKKLFILSVLSLLLVFAFSLDLNAQIISGTQTKGNGSNAQLKCNPVTLNKAAKIVKVSGSNAGFWIIRGSVTISKFWKANDPSAVGVTLKPGTYYIYPNIPKNKNAASVQIHLK